MCTGNGRGHRAAEGGPSSPARLRRRALRGGGGGGGGWHGHDGHGHGHPGHGYGHGHGDGDAELGGGFRGGFGRRFVLRGIMERLEATPAQERVIVEAADEFHEATSKLRGEARRSRGEV